MLAGGTGSSVADRGVRLLMTPACNLQCTFCHNEFQPAGSTRGRFALPLVRDVIQEAADGVDHVSLKFSGGEPLLLKDEVHRLAVALATVPAVRRVVLLSNLQVSVPAGYFESLVEHGLTDVRVNVPSLRAAKYSNRIGGRRSLAPPLARMEDLMRLGVRVEITCVLDEADPGHFLRVVERELEQARVMGVPATTMRFALSAYSGRDVDRWAWHLRQQGFTSTGHRKWMQGGAPTVIVTCCDDWDSEIPSAADWYVRPPGVRMTSLSPGRAHPVSRRDLVLD